MDNIGISLGWRCESTNIAVEHNLRHTKIDGYLTCPFDIGVTNYIGICKCIEDDFKYFCDTSYLVLKKEPPMKKILGDNQTDNQYWIYNTYYNFAFNHESPGHGELFLTQKWEGGINHFVDNNFQHFIERYNTRINNFRQYLALENNHINFIISRYNSIPYELVDIIKKKYPNLMFTIYVAINFSSNSLKMTLKKGEEGIKEFDITYLKYMDLSENEYPEEYERYKKEFDKQTYDNFNHENIKIIYIE